MTPRQSLIAAIQALPMHPQHNLDLLRIMQQVDLEHHDSFSRHRERYARALGQLDMQLSLYAVIGWNIKQAFNRHSLLDSDV